MTTANSGSFVYANPRTIHWGAGTLEARLEQELSQRRLERAFMISTRSVAGKPALMGRLRKILGGRFVGEFSGITQHAPASSVVAAVEAARAAQPDVLISFGGGSPIDATKAVAFARQVYARSITRSKHCSQLVTTQSPIRSRWRR
jgi:alcohol dehydrogenase class IV